MITKTQEKVLEIFVSKVNRRFSIKKISETMKKPYPLIHRSINALIDKGTLVRDEFKLVSLNIRKYDSDVLYAEGLRKDEFLSNNKTIALFAKDVLSGIKTDFFTLLVFGSAVAANARPRDVDILVITADRERAEYLDRVINGIADKFSAKFDITVISSESAHEMLLKRDNANIMNETLNNHILVFGAEGFYRMIQNAL